MADKRHSRPRGRGGSQNAGQKAMNVLGAFVGLAFGLWIYSQVLDVVIPLVNTSTFFGSTITFIVALVPVLGVVAGYKIAKPMFSSF